MKRMPMMEMFLMSAPDPAHNNFPVEIHGEFFYSIKTDTLYIRRLPHLEWEVKCDGGCRDKKCPVKNPENYYFEVVPSHGTLPPQKALR